jgi:hypothetical protein
MFCFHELVTVCFVESVFVVRIDLHFILLFFLLLVVGAGSVLSLGLLLGQDDSFVEILLREDVVDVIRCEIVSKEFVVDGGAHEDDANSRMLPYQSFESEEDEVSVYVSFVDLIKDDEGILFKEVCTVHQSL